MIKIKKSYNQKNSKGLKVEILAVTFILIFMFADIAKLGVAADVEVDLDATPTTADVGEWITFNWTSNGEFHSGQINFGDGNITSLASIQANSTIIHKYDVEGQFNVTLYARNNNTTSEDTDWVFINIKNNPPQFNISLPSSSNEDEAVNVSAIDVVESDHDLQPGILSYIYDFADGTQESSNQSSILHKWKNAGNYLVTITVVDDQGALDQKSQVIEIINVDPTAMFTVDADIPPEQLRSSYYGTYDFRQDIIDTEPAHWDIHDSSSVGVEKTATIKPNEDHITVWNPSGTHYSRVDETYPDGATIYATADNRVDELGFTNFTEDVHITQLTFYLYGKITGQFAAYLSWRIYGGSYSTSKLVSFSYSYSWKSYTWSCDLTKAQLDNLKIKVESYHDGLWDPGRMDIDTIYCEFLYLPNTTVSVVDVGGGFKEAVQLYDEDSEQQAWMENTFSNQQYGTIEYYVKTTSVSSITWALSLWDHSTSLLAFQVLIEDCAWKYTTGTPGTLSELGTALSNTWYWVSIDFCVSGSYLNLSSLQFRVTVNDSTSNIYNFSSVTTINKIRFESAIQDRGTAWIDAIGYSFDPHYLNGDNKISLISYPEKCNVMFSAVNCTDTESDLSSLRFYWQFGDNATDYGKFVKHDYLTSGRYVVNLTCKDDNGAIDSHFEIVLIHNMYPHLNLTVSMENITIHEGETITFNTETLDDSTDMAQLSYWWQFDGSEINPYNLSNCILDGWRTSNLFMEDFNDSVYLLVKDPEGAYDYDSLMVTVLNVDPLISIWDANVIANISFEVFRNNLQKDANFTFQLMADDDIFLEKSLNFSGSQDVIVFSEKELISMTLSRNWKVVVNSSSELPASSWFRCFVRLQFLNGEELVIMSNKLYGGNYGSWETSLNPYFYNNGDLTFMYPITFLTQIWDPSIDDISFDIQYFTEMLLEINCSDTLPISDSFTIEYPLNDANYTVSVYEDNGIKYANITAIQSILSEIYDNNSFPVNLDISFTIYPIIDLFEILDVQLNLTEVSILNCVSAVNFLNASAYDDDFGVDKLDITFYTNDGIEFQNLSPQLELFIPNIATEGTNVTFYAEASDFDQTYNLDQYYTADFTSDVVPLNSDDFAIVNGTLEEFGDLDFYNGNCTVFNADSTYSSPTVSSQPNNFTLISGTSDWCGDFYSIDANYTTFNSTKEKYSISEYIDSITYTKGTSGGGSLENTHTDDSNYKQINAVKDQYYSQLRLWSYKIIVTFNFDPSLAGRDFYLSCDIVTSDTPIGYLKVNGQTISSGGTIDFDDMLIEDVTSITFETSIKYGTFNSKIYYFELTPTVNELNITSTIEVDSTNSTFLFYSHTTNITQAIDMNIWNYDSNQWDLIESSDNDSFSEHIFTLNDDYYNENNETLINLYGVNSESTFSLKIDMLKVVMGNFTLNLTSTLHMDNINDVEIMKYLKLIYGYKTDSPQLINLSLYNFQSESWILIDSKVVGTDIYKNKYSILSAEFYNETYDIILKIEAEVRQFYIDLLKLEYYSTQISDSGSFEHETVSEISEDFCLLDGSCDWDGDLGDQDNDYITFTSQTNEVEFISELQLLGMKPDDPFISINLLWSLKTNVSQTIDVSIYNYDSSNWEVINSSINLQFTNNSYSILNSSYYGPYYTVKVKVNGTYSSEFELYLDKLKLQYSWIKNSYQEDTIYSYVLRQPYDITFYNGTLEDKGDLSYQNSDCSTFTPDGYGSYPAELDFETQFILVGINHGDTINYLSLNYSYRTNLNQLINISIYNFSANAWHLIDSSVHTSFFNGSYLIPADFYNSDFEILARVEGFNNTSDFQLFFDQLKIEYQYTSNFFTSNYWMFFDAVEEDYVIFDSTIEYVGTYSFENDNIGALGAEVSIIDYYIPAIWEPPYEQAHSRVIAELDGHKTILKNFDVSTYAGGYGFQAFHIFPTNIEYGTVELWVYKGPDSYNAHVGCPLVFRSSNNETLFAFNMDRYGDDIVRFTSEGGDNTWEELYADNTWFHIRIDFETREDGNYLGLDQYTLNFWFDGDKELDGVNFYANGTLSNLYWYSTGWAKTANYYFDAISFSWDNFYEVELNEDPYPLVNELFDLEFTDMDSVKYELFVGAELSYSFKTNISHEVTIGLFNYSSLEWLEIDTIILDVDTFYNATYWFMRTDFINLEYGCKVRIFGYNDSSNDFELHLSQLELTYTWGGVACDLGQYNLVHDLAINLEMSSPYSTIYEEDFIFDAEGFYLVTMTADDGYSISKNGTIIEVNNYNPTASIGNFPNQTIEDKNVFFTSKVQVFGSNSTQSDLRYFWSFGDGLYSFEASPVHAWSEAGVYNISLTIVDCYANIYTDIKNITILEKAPEITGPFTFHGVEGQSIDLEVDIFDAFKDELTIEYKWYNSTGLFSTDKKPSVILHDGSYDYILNVTDSMGQTATANISVVVEDVPPVILVSNYMYSGGTVLGDEGFFIGAADDPGEFELHAYAYDTFDNADLDYYWKIFKGESTFSTSDLDSGIESSVKLRVKETVLYRGEVRVKSADMSTTATFVINCVIDNNGNGFSDEFETRLLETYENITAYSDTDDDCFTDLYEIGISNTSYLDPDTDGDGLFDSLDPITGIGESSAKTDPLDWDTDNDALSDGIEVVGWQISTEFFGEIIVNSDPWDNNSDSDNLSDYEEYYTGTDPRNSDSDNDGANDDIDPYPMKWDGDEDGLCDGLELEIGTNPNNTDTDSDGLSDGEEVIGWTFKTNPLTADSDHDFVADTAEMQNYKVAIDDRYDLDESVSLAFEVYCRKAVAAQIAFLITFGEAINEPEEDEVYGIQEVPDLFVSIYKVDDNLLLFNMTSNKTRYFSQVVDIREIVENNSPDYRGEYMIQINDTSAGCILEQFEIEIAGYLDPNDYDFDNDCIMDGVELGLLVEGTDIINFNDFYEYDNLTVDFDAETYDEFYLDIPHIGRVYDADVTLEVVSEGTPTVGGNITIQLIREEINGNIDDVLLVNYTAEFDNNSAFTYENSLNLYDYLNNDTITEYYGTYQLKIAISQNCTTFDNFTLSEFYIETDTFIQAEATDTEAWYTDPANPDTDYDGWNDYYEIFTKSTNPISTDTDGDGVYDSYDRDPKRDVMLEISPISGTAPGQYKLVIVIVFSLSGSEDGYYIPTPKVRAHEFENSLWTAYYDGSHGSSTELHYYANIDDHIRVQENYLDFSIQLWRVDRYFGLVKKWDKKLVGEIDNYRINNVGHSEVLSVTKYDDSQELVYEAKIEVKTIAVEKANTIAIYEKNGTVFNGHYQSQERMNIIQLYVNDNPSANSPFVKGPNNIVIPTSFFTETILNGYIQNERLNETFFYSDDEEIFKFISVEREGYTEQACEEIDFVMIRFDISTSDAEKLLDLILTCVINESLDENNNTITTDAILYACYSTKLEGTSATLMNLPHSVLGFIPWYCEFTESPQGSKPKDFDDWFWAPLKAVVGFVGGLTITLLMLLVAIFALIVAFVINIVLLVLLPILAYILWLIIRVALLILAFILLAIHILTQIIIYATIGISMLVITAIMGGYTKFGLNFVEFSINDKVTRMQSDIIWIYWEFFDMKFPWVKDKIIQGSETVSTIETAVLIGEDKTYDHFDESSMIPEEPQNPPELHCHYEQIGSTTTYDFWVIYDDSTGGDNAPDSEYGVRLHLIAPNGTVLSPIEMGVHPDYSPDPDYSEPVKYNYTIDLNTLYNKTGLWHFYFSTKDNSTEHDVIFMPEMGYMLGPLTTPFNPPILQYSTFSDDPNEWVSVSGFKDANFTFSVRYYGGEAPESMSLCLVPANNSGGAGSANKTMGIKKFSMQPTIQNPNYSESVDFSCILNFTSLGYDDSELGWFSHYYEVILDDGNKTYLYDYDINEEDDFYPIDILGPNVVDAKAQIVDYDFCDTFLNMGILGSSNPYGPRLPLYVANDFSVYQFKVNYEDPYDNPPLEGYPRIVFTNHFTGRQLEPIVMDDIFYDDFYNVEGYACLVRAADLGPGYWNFTIECKDSNGVPTDPIQGKEKIWNIGNPLHAVDSFSINMLSIGTLPLACFVAASSAAQSPGLTSKALALTGVFIGIGSVFASIGFAMQSPDPCYLLGISLAAYFTGFMALSATCAPKGSTSTRIPSLHGTRSLFSTLVIPMKFMSFLSLSVILLMGISQFLPMLQTIVDVFFIANWMDFILTPLTLLSNLALSMAISPALTAALQIPAGGGTFVKSLLLAYGFILLVIGAVTTCLFIGKSQYYPNYF